MAQNPRLKGPRAGGTVTSNQWGGVLHRRRRPGEPIAIIYVVLASLLFASVAHAQTDCEPAAGNWFQHPLLVTQVPLSQQQQRLAAPGTLRAPFSGTRIVVVDRPSSSRLLAPGFHSTADPDVSFDGKRVLFAGKPTPRDPWSIYEIALDTGNVRKITKMPGDCRLPSYQGAMYTITENEPWYQITFVHTEPGLRSELGKAPLTTVCSCRLDGSFVQRLTHQLSSTFDPVVMRDGRLLFSAWQGTDWNHGPAGRVNLMGVNTDGIDYAAFCGNVGRRVKHMPCVTRDGLAVFVEADEIPWDGAGMLACVSLRRPLHSYRPLTTAPDGLFHSPWGLADGSILVSRRPADGTAAH